jgi:hypothetical protein
MFTQHKKWSFQSSAVVGGMLAAFTAGWLATESAFSTWLEEALPQYVLTVSDPMESIPPEVVEEDRRFLETVMQNGTILGGPVLSARR